MSGYRFLGSLSVLRPAVLLLGVAVWGLAALPAAAAPAAKPVDFNRQIRPLLSDRCYTCHGPDKSHREAELRFDLRDVAIKEAIVPGKAKDSPLIERITSDDEDEVMHLSQRHTTATRGGWIKPKR